MSQIHPLRIQKGTPTLSPTKSSGAEGPLRELSSSAVRRNSPSTQSTKKQLLDTSSFETSPFSSKFSSFTSAEPTSSHWQNRSCVSPTRGIENRDPGDDSPVASKRPSVENLKRASRVSKSNIFALEQKNEYDPLSPPQIERSLGVGIPLGLQARNSILGSSRFQEKKKSDERSKEAVMPKVELSTSVQASTEADHRRLATTSTQASPTKSAMSQNPRYSLYDPETSVWSEADEEEDRKLPPGKSLHRYAKSVTFNASPPEINEYEQVTPDPSISTDSREGSCDNDENDDGEVESDGEDHERAGSQDSFDESLEDTDKTPVVLPEDWRFMSPETASIDIVSRMDDPFGVDDCNHGATLANAVLNSRASPSRTDSLNSNGSRRPLPPLPPPSFPRTRSDSHDSFEAVAERAATVQRNVHAPPSAAPISKEELRNIGNSSMTLVDRLQLMSVQEQSKSTRTGKPQDETRERRMRRKSGLHNNASESEIKIFEDDNAPTQERDNTSSEYDLLSAPLISRASILRKVKGQTQDGYQSPEPESPALRPLTEINPDEPIGSYEESSSFLETVDGVKIKEEDDGDSVVDLYTIPQHCPEQMNFGDEANVKKASTREDDADSQYSTDMAGQAQDQLEMQADEPLTPRPTSALLDSKVENQSGNSDRMSLLQFTNSFNDAFAVSLSSHMILSQDSMVEPMKHGSPCTDQSVAESMQSPQLPEMSRLPGYSEEELLEPSTPDSVIRRSISQDSILEEQEEIPEPSATIKAQSSKLKTRPSLTPQDVQTMAETRRQVSDGSHKIPPIPERNTNRPSTVLETDSFLEDSAYEGNDTLDIASNRQSKRRSSLLQLNIPVNEEVDELSFGLDREFDRVIEAQKVAFESLLQRIESKSRDVLPDYVPAIDPLDLRGFHTDKYFPKQKGYLMRQNTKVIVASSGSNTTTTSDDNSVSQSKPAFDAVAARETKSANNSPIKKQKHEISGAWQTHEWNGKVRRKSIRQSGGLPSEFSVSGGVPPLPGLSSAVASMDSVDEAEESEMEHPGGVERGRLFVRVVGVRDLNLPLPRNERSSFALTLDNGLHCVTTSWLDLSKNAAIGQEFELVVLNDLEFQLTLQTKLEQPKVAPRPESPNKLASPTKKPGFSRFFGSPKKKREQELKEQQERLAKQRAQDQARNPSAWDLLHNTVAKDGSFARAYISLKEYEEQAFGRPLTVNVPCFNEWATEEARTSNSTRSGKFPPAGGLVQRKAPYQIGKLELQLLYVPRTKETKDEEMPKSMNACIREIQEAEKTSSQSHEGYLSQQGGDCPYWRRRFFRLVGSKLTAYHEATRQPRATINLAKAAKLIDDKSNLKQQSGIKNGGRRKSAFGSEEEGYMFLEEGFRVRFSNGETIDFYADNVAQKDEWMHALSEVVGRESKLSKGWTDVVLKREKLLKQMSAQQEHEHEKRKASAESKAQASVALGGFIPGPRTSSKDVSRRPLSSQGCGATLRSSNSAPGDASVAPATPAKDRRTVDPAERRAKARSTYY